MPEAGRRDVLDQEALDGLRPAAWTLVALYSVFAVTHWFFLPPGARRVMVPLTAAEALAILAVLGAWARWPPRPAAAHAWVLLLGALALLNSGALLALTGEPKQATNLLFLLIGGGFLLLRRAPFAAYTASVVAVFASAALLGPPSGDWTHYTFGMVSAVALASVVHTVRRASTLRLDRARQEAEESERRLRTVLTAAPLVLFALDRDGVFTLAEGKGLEKVGFRPEDVLGRRVEDVFGHSPAMPAVRRALAGEPQAITVEEQGRLFDVAYTPLPEGGLVGVATDVTDRRSAERAADEASRLRELDRLRTSFVNIAAHELNTPLTPIQMQLSLVDSPDEERREKAARILRRNVGRLARIVNDLVAVNRLEQGRLEVRPAAIDLARVVQDSADSFRDAAAARGIGLQVDAAGPAPAWGDAERLHQVVDNLVSNALKFTPPGGTIRVNVAAAAEAGAGAEAEAGHARVEVRDSGPGIAANDLPRLFQPFSQLEAGRQRGGTGLGLHLSQGIVQAHGGRIWAASPGPGQGATFAFTVPREPPAGPGA